MSFLFYTPINDAGALLAAAHTSGDGHLVLDDASEFAAANPSPTNPIRVCAGPCVFKITGIDGSTLLIGSLIEGTTDTSLPINTLVEDRVTAGDISDLQQAIIDSDITIGNISDELDLKAPADSPVLTNVVTQNTTVDHGYTQLLNNTGTVLPTNIPWGESYEGYNFSGNIDNAYMRGFLQHLKLPGYPAFWEQWENWWLTNNSFEYHTNYISKNSDVTYRPWGSALELSTHTLDYFMQFLGTWVLRGIGSGYGDTDPPLLQWDGTTGSLAGRAFVGTSFAGDGSGLTSLPAGNLTGTIADARFPSHLLVDSNNDSLGVHVTDMNDMVTGLNWFKVGGNNTGQSFGYQGAWISFIDGTHKCLWTPQVIGSFSNEPFSIITNSVAVATFGTDGSLVLTGPLTAGGVQITSTTIGFFGATPVTKRSGDIATGLVALGLFSSATVASATTISGSITESQVTNLVTDLAAKATDSLVIHKAGGDTITCSTAATKGLIVKGGTTARTITNVALTSNVVTITTSVAHGFTVGQTGVNTGLTTPLNDAYVIASVPTTTTFTYAKTAANITSVADSGTATANQTANLLEVQNPAGTTLVSIMADGTVSVGPTSILPDGRVGVGTSQPDRLLHVNGTGHQYIHFSTTSGVDYDIAMQFSDTTYTIYEGLLGNAAGTSVGGTAGTWGVYVNNAVRLAIPQTGNVGIGTFAPGAQLQVNTSAATTIGLIVKRFASQSASLQEWQDSTGSTLTRINSSGFLRLATGQTSVSALEFYDNTYAIGMDNNSISLSYGAAGAFKIKTGGVVSGTIRASLDSNFNFGVGLGVASTEGTIHAKSTAITTPTLVVDAFASQTADLTWWRNSSGGLLANMTKDGVQAAKGFAPAINATAKASAYTISTADSTILGDASGGNFAITLPAANAVITGRVFVVKSVSTGTVTLTAAGSDVIDGAGTYPLATQYKYVTVQSDGVSKWYVIGNN